MPFPRPERLENYEADTECYVVKKEYNLYLLTLIRQGLLRDLRRLYIVFWFKIQVKAIFCKL